MDWKAHLLLGVASGAAVAALLRLEGSTLLLFSSLSGASALLPDLDIRSSKASRAAYAAAFLLLLASAYLLSFANGGGLQGFAFAFVGAMFAADLNFSHAFV